MPANGTFSPSWGRVNTRRRFDLIVATGAADSFDGSKWARFRNTYLPGGLKWLEDAAATRREALANRPQETRTMHDPQRWTVAIFGGIPASVRYRLEDEPEDRELEALLAKHAATDAVVYPPAAATPAEAAR